MRERGRSTLSREYPMLLALFHMHAPQMILCISARISTNFTQFHSQTHSMCAFSSVVRICKLDRLFDVDVVCVCVCVCVCVRERERERESQYQSMLDETVSFQFVQVGLRHGACHSMSPFLALTLSSMISVLSSLMVYVRSDGKE